jgi:hypothetical protein
MNASVLRDRIFVQMSEARQNKFKLGVARTLQSGRKGPKLEQAGTTNKCVAATGKDCLTLTARNVAVLNRGGGWGEKNG